MNAPLLRLPSRKFIFLIGASAGLAGFLIAKVMVPVAVSSFQEHDLFLARNIGFVFPALIGLAAGCVEGSLSRMLLGMTVGSLVGFLYASLCGNKFDVVMAILGLPCFCGGLMAALVGSSQSSWLTGVPVRLGKGMVAGLACGAAYLLSVNLIVTYVLSPVYVPDVSAYRSIVWKTGLPSMIFAGGIFQCLFCWAIGLRSASKPSALAATPEK